MIWICLHFVNVIIQDGPHQLLPFFGCFNLRLDFGLLIIKNPVKGFELMMDLGVHFFFQVGEVLSKLIELHGYHVFQILLFGGLVISWGVLVGSMWVKGRILIEFGLF